MEKVSLRNRWVGALFRQLVFRYLTRLQMIQFVIVFLHAFQTLYYDCNYPRIIPKVKLFILNFLNLKSSSFQLQTLNMVIFFVLFGNYYFYAYINKNKKYQ